MGIDNITKIYTTQTGISDRIPTKLDKVGLTDFHCPFGLPLTTSLGNKGKQT